MSISLHRAAVLLPADVGVSDLRFQTETEEQQTHKNVIYYSNAHDFIYLNYRYKSKLKYTRLLNLTGRDSVNI